jgi:hypothetical protein
MTNEPFTIVCQKEDGITIVFPCDSAVLDETGSTRRLEGPYTLNCKNDLFQMTKREVAHWKRFVLPVLVSEELKGEGITGTKGN